MSRKPAPEPLAKLIAQMKEGKVVKTYRASTDDYKEIEVHDDERFQLLPNGAPFS